MPDELSWDDAEEIGALLRARFPDTDPQSVSELEIARWTRELPGLVGEPASELHLQQQIEAIRAAWSRG